jgi:hypothetical protein
MPVTASLWAAAGSVCGREEVGGDGSRSRGVAQCCKVGGTAAGSPPNENEATPGLGLPSKAGRAPYRPARVAADEYP